MGCVSVSSCINYSIGNSDPEPGTSSHPKSASKPPWIQDWAEALQLPCSSLPSNGRWTNWVEQRAAYHREGSPEDAASRGDDASSISDDLCNSEACRTPPARRSPRTPQMFSALRPVTRSAPQPPPSAERTTTAPPGDSGPPMPLAAVHQEA